MYIIIGGGGDVGYYLTRNLLHQGHEVLLLEKGQERYQSLSDELGQSVLKGDACESKNNGGGRSPTCGRNYCGYG